MHGKDDFSSETWTRARCLTAVATREQRTAPRLLLRTPFPSPDICLDCSSHRSHRQLSLLFKAPVNLALAMSNKELPQPQFPTKREKAKSQTRFGRTRRHLASLVSSLYLIGEICPVAWRRDRLSGRSGTRCTARMRLFMLECGNV